MIILSQEQIDSLVEHAKKVLPNEACGLLGGTIDGDAKVVKKIYFLTNTDASPEHFSMEPAEQFAVVKDMRSNGLKLLGNFHSHPSTPARPSEEDKRLVFDTKLSYLILSLENEPTLKSFTFDCDKNVFDEAILAPNLAEKLERLKNYLRELKSVAIAFSSGVDSTFLLKTAHDVLGDKVVAVTASSKMFPRHELEESKKFCRDEHIRQIIFDVDELSIAGFEENPPNRCYLCKRSLFTKIKEIAAQNNLKYVAEGSNMDDNGDYRPGLKAVAELEVKSPLRQAELYKTEIRELSRAMNLPTADKPSFACLASRFVYGEKITPEKLSMVDRAEELLREKGFKQFRVRVHDKLARIEILPTDLEKIIQPNIREEIATKLRTYGFDYIALDLQGYRTGSMNIGIKESD